ncbi:hypothetical protein DRE_04079 [Drechslerella stenobrocha 248]|uniref:Synaptobrevin n=1 Tax=Drechslerella stenobrocha 248 TaxID=1043628 RepID=W7I2I4_9PEZI|nr:hypothetical protein DRE_04079 [Drechslerella stenobrocha 248]
MAVLQGSSDAAAVSLARLLARLELKFPASVRHAEAARARPSAFDLARIKANFEYAHKLMRQAEGDAAVFKNPSQRQKALSDLQQQKITMKRLDDLLTAWELLEDTTVIHVDEPAADDKEETKAAESPIPVTATPPPSKPQAPAEAPAAPVAPTPSNEPVFVLRNRFQKSNDTEKAGLSADDQIAHDQHEQDDLSESLVKMAAQLKENSRRFADDLENEKDVLRMAAEGLDKSTTGMQGAGLRMLQLKQGQDVTWWYQMKVFAALIGLALTAIIIFWLPKLRWGSFV